MTSHVANTMSREGLAKALAVACLQEGDIDVGEGRALAVVTWQWQLAQQNMSREAISAASPVRRDSPARRCQACRVSELIFWAPPELPKQHAKVSATMFGCACCPRFSFEVQAYHPGPEIGIGVTSLHTQGRTPCLDI